MRRYFEDFQVGETWQSDTVTLSEADIVDYARVHDPQPIHTDPQSAASGPFGSVIASGWQIAALSMRLFIEAGGYGDTPVVGMGIEHLRWRRPVRPGDTLTVTREVIATERSEKRPDCGLIRTQVNMTNQDDEVVMTLISLGQVPAQTQG